MMQTLLINISVKLPYKTFKFALIKQKTVETLNNIKYRNAY